MQTQHAYSGDKKDPAVQVREWHTGELEDAVARYRPMLYRRAYRYVGDPQDAEDAVQDALLSAYKHLDQFRATAKMTSWLTTIVTNSALTQLRRRPRQPHLSLDERTGEEQNYSVSDTLVDARPNPERQCASWESHGFLMQFVAELSPLLQQAFQLCYLDGLSISEAGQSLNVSTATIKARAWRARSQLKRMMGEMSVAKEYANELCAQCKAV